MTNANAESFYKWVDARGNTQYGDKPPAGKGAKKVKMPAITVIKDYSKQWKPLDLDNKSLPNQPGSAKTPVRNNPKSYTTFAFVAPKGGQTIRANDGDISAMLSLKPPLKKGHKITFSINGKEVAKSKSRTNNFSNLTRGTHTISAKIVNNRGKILKSSSVTFHVQRHSALFKK